MLDQLPVFIVSKKSKFIFALSILISAFWLFGQKVNVYQYALSGVIYEVLWLPVLGLLFFLPLISIFSLFKQKLSFKSLYLYSIIIIGLTAFLSR
jgi:hypothetical protein